MPRRFALIPAAGGGSRFGAATPKQYAPLAGVPVLARTLARLRSAWRAGACSWRSRPTTCVRADGRAAVRRRGVALRRRHARRHRAQRARARSPRTAPPTTGSSSTTPRGRACRATRSTRLVEHLRDDAGRRTARGPGRRHAEARRRRCRCAARGRHRAARGPVAGADAADVPLRRAAARVRRDERRSPAPTRRRRSRRWA